jgi:endonuclease III
VAELVVKEIFELYPDPIDVDEVTLDPINDSYQTLYEIIRVLGLGKNRMRYLVEMSRQFVRCRALFGDDYRLYRVREFTGCGQYAIDAWRLFVLKERCRPLDRHLIRYAVKEGLVDENI